MPITLPNGLQAEICRMMRKLAGSAAVLLLAAWLLVLEGVLIAASLLLLPHSMRRRRLAVWALASERRVCGALTTWLDGPPAQG